MTVVYVDSVFVLNTLMDYLLLAATAHLAGIPLRRGRYLLSALLGGAYAVAVFLPGCGILSGWPVKLLAGVLLAAAAFGGQRKLLRLTLLLFAVSCGFAGCVLGLGLLAGGGVPMENGVFYTDVDAKVLLIAAGAAYLVLSAVFRAGARHGVNGTLVPATIAWGERSVSLTALCDTGNELRDPVTGRPLLVVCGGRLTPLWPPELRGLLTARTLRSPADLLEQLNRHETRFRLAPYSAVGVSGGLMLTFRSDWVRIGKNRYEKLLVALSPTELGDSFTALWGGTEGGNSDAEVEKMPAAAACQAGAAAAGKHLLHRRQRYSAAAASQGPGGGAAGENRRGGRSEDADRAQSAAGGVHRPKI